MPAKPKSPFPSPAATLLGEADILANVLADLSDHDAKLVYADWLEERDDKRGPLLRKFVTAFRDGKKLPAFNAGRGKSAPKPWRNLVGLTLMEKLRGSALEPKGDKILALARPTLGHKRVRASDRSLPVGASKLGGQPDMPAGVEWPEYGSEPLSFLGQFNLTDLQASPVARELPATGVLSLFCLHDEECDPDEFVKGNWRVFHFPDTAKLARRDFPDELPEAARPATCRLTFIEGQSLPNLESPWKKELLRIAPAKDDEDYTYRNFIDSMFDDGLLGYPPALGNDVLGKKSMRHLVTLGDYYSEWEWIDGDVMYFILSEKDLKQGRFDRVQMVVENY